jgi:hypothetical protein
MHRWQISGADLQALNGDSGRRVVPALRRDTGAVLAFTYQP